MHKRLFAVLILLGFSVQTYAGTDTSGGGDVYAAEFIEIAKKLAEKIDANPIQLPARFTVEKFKKTIDQASIETTTQELWHDGHRVDAINHPGKNRIELSLVNWADKMTSDQKERLVLHESLGLMSIGDKNFVTTQAILANIAGFPHDLKKICESQHGAGVNVRRAYKVGDSCWLDTDESKLSPEIQKALKTIRKFDRVDAELSGAKNIQIFTLPSQPVDSWSKDTVRISQVQELRALFNKVSQDAWCLKDAYDSLENMTSKDTKEWLMSEANEASPQEVQSAFTVLGQFMQDNTKETSALIYMNEAHKNENFEYGYVFLVGSGYALLITQFYAL